MSEIIYSGDTPDGEQSASRLGIPRWAREALGGMVAIDPNDTEVVFGLMAVIVDRVELMCEINALTDRTPGEAALAGCCELETRLGWLSLLRRFEGALGIDSVTVVTGVDFISPPLDDLDKVGDYMPPAAPDVRWQNLLAAGDDAA